VGGGGFWTKEKDAVMKLQDCHTNTEFLRKVVTKNVEEGQKRAAASFDSKMEKRESVHRLEDRKQNVNP